MGGLKLGRLLLLIPALAIAGGIFYLRSRPRVVEVIQPTRKTVVESIAATGRMRGQVETSVGAPVSGRVSAMLVREGERVLAGQVIARLDDTVLRSQLRQAQDSVRTAEVQLVQADDAVRTAEAQLAQASRPPLASDIARLKADIAQNVAVAEAKRAAARQRLAELREGATREQRDQIAAQVEQAKAQAEQAQKDYERQLALYKEGAVALNAVESAETALKVARRALENLIARQNEINAGTRAEQIAQAEADLRAAEATVRGAQASGEAQLRSLLSTPRPEDVAVARNRVYEARRAREVAAARLREARMALSVAKSRLEDTVVTAPFDGTVTQIVTESGGVTGPNQPIVRLVRFSRPEIRIDVDEVNLGKIQLGQEAVVSCDAFPGQTFKAQIRAIGAQVDADRGTVEVRLDPVNPPEWLRPGQTISVNIIVDRGAPRFVIPLTAVNTIGGSSSVLVVEQERVSRRELVVGAPGPDGMPVKEGLKESDLVIVNPAGLTVGQKVAPKIKGWKR